MDEELRRIRAEEALADSVYKRFPGQSLTRDGAEEDLDSEEQRAADDRNALLGSVL